MSYDFYEKFYIKLNWTYSKVVLDLIEYLDTHPCDYKVERKYGNYYERCYLESLDASFIAKANRAL